MGWPRDLRPFDDFTAADIEMFTLQQQLPPGLGLRDLISLGVIEDIPEVLNAPPVNGLDGMLAQSQAAVGTTMRVNGQRMTLAFRSELETGQRPLGYAPPVVNFGSTPFVPGLPGFVPGLPRTPITGQFFTKVPVGPGFFDVSLPGGVIPFSITSRGQFTSPLLFTLIGPSVPSPSITPLPPRSLSCSRLPGGQNSLSWTLPWTTFADFVTPFSPSQVNFRVFRNGAQVPIDAPVVFQGATTRTIVDPPAGGLYPLNEADLYQVVAVGGGGQFGIPSDVCRVEPRFVAGEVTLLLIDRSASMGELRADGTTRFQGVVGPLIGSQIPRAFAAIQEIFQGPGAKQIAIWSFNSADGVVDHIRPLTGQSFTGDRTVAQRALAAVFRRGTGSATPVADAMCLSAAIVVSQFQSTVAGRADVRIFTDGGENASTGPAFCAAYPLTSTCSAVPSVTALPPDAAAECPGGAHASGAYAPLTLPQDAVAAPWVRRTIPASVGFFERVSNGVLRAFAPAVGESGVGALSYFRRETVPGDAGAYRFEATLRTEALDVTTPFTEPVPFPYVISGSGPAKAARRNT